ncbi:MAG TPA: DoxX family protein [Polyangiaceae bacterium]
MKTNKWVSVARYVQGAAFFIFGLNGFLHFLPQPAPPEAAQALMGGFAASGYMFPLIKGTEVVTGALLLLGRFVPLSLVLIAPVIVNIVLYHLFLAPTGLAVPLLLLATELYLAWSYRHLFAPLLQPLVQPRDGRTEDVTSRDAASAAV